MKMYDDSEDSKIEKYRMKLLSLNLRFGGGNRIKSILNYLISHSPDLIVLGEFKDNKNGQIIMETLKSEGYSFESSDDDLLGVLVASKYPFSIIKREQRMVGIELLDYNLRILGVYVPTGSKDKRFKDAIWQKIINYAQENQNIPSIITGDFNSCTKDDSMNQTQYNGEDIKKLLGLGYVDSWKHYKNDDSECYTWYSNIGNGFRFDYAFVSLELQKQIEMLDIFHDSKSREAGMTDHSPLIMEYLNLSTEM